jgi:hypothetical protein
MTSEIRYWDDTKIVALDLSGSDVERAIKHLSDDGYVCFQMEITQPAEGIEFLRMRTYIEPEPEELETMNSTPATRQLVTVSQLCDDHYSCFTKSQLRNWIYDRDKNGFSMCVVKPNKRRILIDLDRFNQWLDVRTAQFV